MSSLQATHDGTTSNNRRHTSHSLELRAVPSIAMEDLRNRVDARAKEALNIEDNASWISAHRTILRSPRRSFACEVLQHQKADVPFDNRGTARLFNLRVRIPAYGFLLSSRRRLSLRFRNPVLLQSTLLFPALKVDNDGTIHRENREGHKGGQQKDCFCR